MQRFLMMMIKAATAIFLMACLQTAQAADDAAAQLTKILSGISSMQASFTQQTLDAKGNAQPVLTGKMSVKRPGLFRWEVLKPSPQTIVSSGNVMWIYDPELEQATKQKLDAQAGNTPALLLSGDPRKLNEAFVITVEPGSEAKVYLLKPRGTDALFNNLRVYFKGNELSRMELADSLGQKTDIRFKDVRMNPVLAASVFEFTPPKGVDVIDQF
jgi:outer membrane lipoprotein carrier protein